MKARWKRREKGEMSDPEQAWAVELERRSTEVEPDPVFAFRFESLKLRLADSTFYTPDFLVLRCSGEVELHEVKGSWSAPNQDKSRVKLKVAAEMFPWFTFKAVVATKVPLKNGGGWKFEVETIGNGGGDE